MYAQLLKEIRQLKDSFKNAIEEIEDLREEVEVLKGKKKKKGKPKQKLKRPKGDSIKPPWEREGFKSKKEWKDNKH